MAMPIVKFDSQAVMEEMAARGWQVRDLAGRAGLSQRTAYRFLSGEVQTIHAATRIAEALGFDTPERYVIRGTAA